MQTRLQVLSQAEKDQVHERIIQSMSRKGDCWAVSEKSL